MIALLAMVALGGPPAERNLSVSTVGMQYWQAPALKGSDVDVLFGQRLRWTLFDNGTTAGRLRLDGRFTLSPGDATTWKRNRVRQLGVSILNDTFTLELGRSRVHKGGPRLVDGVQFIAHTSPTVDIGVWGGAAPDLFTTEPRARFGAGPIIAYTASRVQASMVGDVLIAGGGLDRASALFQGRVSAARTLDVAARFDVQLSGGPRLVDGQLFGRWAPNKRVSLEVLYNVFSSFLYQNTQDLDPKIQRFDQRMLSVNQDYLPLIRQNCLDPGIAQQIGGDARLRPDGNKTGLMASLSTRYRFGNQPNQADACFYDPTNRYLRVSPRVGVANLPIGGGLDITLDANLYNVEGYAQSDAGLTVFFEPTDDGMVAIDSSYRMLFFRYDAADPTSSPNGYYGTGHYADLFVDVMVPAADLTVGMGMNLESEPSELVNEVGIGAFARITKYLRPSKK